MGVSEQQVVSLAPVSTVRPGERGYTGLTMRGRNGRFAGRPRVIYLPHTPDEVLAAVGLALRDGHRIAVRAGGHCLEDFVDGPHTEALIDLGRMRGVTFDPELGAFAVSAGTRLGEMYTALLDGWGVTAPAGVCPDVGVGGHIAGGGYGALSRQHGLVVDHLYAVEVVVVDASGPRIVVATREPDDPDRDLWWAHTGGGGGTFGVVTRYWLRSPGSDGSDPATALVRPPATLYGASMTWRWADLDRDSFTRLVGNYQRWHEANSGLDSAFLGLESGFTLSHRSADLIQLDSQIDGDLPDAAERMDEFLRAVTAGAPAPRTDDRGAQPWLEGVLSYPEDGMRLPCKSKAAFLRTPWTDDQIAVLYTALATGDHEGGAVILDSFGGRINAVAPDATAMAHRDSVVMAYFNVDWYEPSEEAASIAWIRQVYHGMYASTGGVPVPDDANGGVFINYTDVDLADPEWNTSGVPWHTLLHRDNYRALQRVKARWDPNDVFRRRLSVRPSEIGDQE